jgi:undecaprenyl diphosphate synthase
MAKNNTPDERPPLAQVPRHVAIIMDGNGRWAQARGLPRLAGHRAGTDNIRRVLEGCVEFGVKILTIYAFSTENWGRPQPEVLGLIRILGEVIDRETANLNRNGVQLRHIGRMEGIPPALQQKVRQAIEVTRNNERLILNVAFNYGGRDEILHAVQGIVRAQIKPEDINEAMFNQYLFTAGQPDPDLIVRTGGDWRLSNFLIWQAAYAEYYTTPAFWPDFDKDELYKALQAYNQRERRFGLVPQKK